MASLYKQQLVQYLESKRYRADQVLDVGGGEKKTKEYTTVDCNRYLVMDMEASLKPDFVHDLNQFAHPEEIFAVERDPGFDLIFCLNVFEYVWNPYNAVANLYTWLKPGGKLVVNFPFLYPLHNPEGIDYLRYTHEWVQKMFHERFKFSEVNTNIIQATDGANELISFYTKEKMHYRKNDGGSWMEIGCIVECVK